MPSKKINLFEVEPHFFEVLDLENFKIGYFIAKNKEKSQTNEDVLFFNMAEDKVVMGVADGAGGHARGKDAAKICGDLFIAKDYDKEQLNPLQTIEEINESILNLKAGAASTLTFVTIEAEDLRAYSVGDSEIILWNAQGREVYSNIPQSNIGYEIEAGLIDQEKSLDRPDRHQVNNLLGDGILRIEATSKISIKRNQTLLLGSDGLFDNFSHEELTKIVATGRFESSFEDLVSMCVHQGKNWKKDDDISFILLRKK